MVRSTDSWIRKFNCFWKNIAPRPGTSQYADARNGKNDEMHVVVVDDNGSVSGISGNILEKFTNLSKATDARITPSENIYYKNYIENNSNYLFAGATDSLVAPSFTTLGGFTVTSGSAITWGQDASGVTFGLAGNKTYTLNNGANYGVTNDFAPTLANVISAYTILENPAEYDVNFLIQGPSGGDTLFESQAKANKLIAIAEGRKDCVAVISPHRAGVVNVTNPDTQTNNIIQFYDSITSSSYAVFDSGYKYMFDRFNNKFVYIPLNGDVAGLMQELPSIISHGSLQQVLREEQLTMQSNLHIIQLRHKEIFSILRESTLLSSHQDLELFSSVIRLVLHMLLHLIESMFVVSS